MVNFLTFMNWVDEVCPKCKSPDIETETTLPENGVWFETVTCGQCSNVIRYEVQDDQEQS